MSDNGEVEVESPTGYQVLPKEVAAEIGSIKLFNKWSYEDIEVRDMSLTYVCFRICTCVNFCSFVILYFRSWAAISFAGITCAGLVGDELCRANDRDI